MSGVSREVRGIPPWLLRAYLVEAGGVAEDGDTVCGDGWTVRMERIEDHVIGSLRVGQVRLDLEGDAASVARLLALLEPRLLRAGG